jgi:hypothetical protein
VSAAAAAAQPDWFDRTGEALADRVNPIIVKEVRQGLRTRVFWVFFTLLLVANLFISLGFFAAADSGGSSGRSAFGWFFSCLALVQFFVIPYSAYRSMARETEEETWVLLTLTGLGPRRILLGKLGSYVLQGSLYSSAAAPFLLFSYYLNGIDLPTIIMAVVASVAYQVFLVSVSVSLATMADSRIVRALLHFVLLGLLMLGLFTGIGVAAGLAEASRRLFGSGDFWLVSSSVVFALLTTGLVLFETAAARLSLPTEDYARGPRLGWLAQLAGMLGFFTWAFVSSNEAEFLPAASVGLSAYALLVGVMVTSDRDGMARSHWAKAGRYALLRPGALRGFVLVVLSLLVGCALVLGLSLNSTATPEQVAVVVAAPAFALVYLAASNLVARWVPHPPYQTPAMVRLVFLGLVVLGTGLPPLLGELLAEADDERFNLLNPVLGLVNIGKAGLSAEPLVVVVWGVAALLGTLAFISLRRRDREV